MRDEHKTKDQLINELVDLSCHFLVTSSHLNLFVWKTFFDHQMQSCENSGFFLSILSLPICFVRFLT